MSSYALRLPESLKQAAKRIAAADRTTMNPFFVMAVAEKISGMETARFFEQRATLLKSARPAAELLAVQRRLTITPACVPAARLCNSRVPAPQPCRCSRPEWGSGESSNSSLVIPSSRQLAMTLPHPD